MNKYVLIISVAYGIANKEINQVFPKNNVNVAIKIVLFSNKKK